jgi:acyl-CoA synthetase (AMP-forming)/AMP-acid ligase II
MAASAVPDRLAFRRTTFAGLESDALRGTTWLGGESVGTVAFLGQNSPLLPTLLFSAAGAGLPFAPLNYRLSAQMLRDLLGRLDSPLVVAGADQVSVARTTGYRVLSTQEWLTAIHQSQPTDEPAEVSAEAAAVLLFTSGTTAEPKCVMLRHSHLLSYVLGTVEFASADETECALVCVPPYHIAGIGSVLSNIYAGRRVIHLPGFDPAAWLNLVREHQVTTAMVVPTMLARIVEHLDGWPANCPTLAALAYGGARMPLPVLEDALRAFPQTAFTNAYGLTETSSTIALLGPEDHRAAVESEDPAARARLSSAGRLIPGVEAQIRTENGSALTIGEIGELWVRGPQVSGEYRGQSSVLDAEGWFPTHDLARLDAAGYLYLEGRADDMIIRGGENIAPAEVEDALLRHPAVAEVAVVGLPNDEWGQRLVAAIVLRPGATADEQILRAHVRDRLRGSRTPDDIVFRADLPRTPTGKVLRRRLVQELGEVPASVAE